MTTLTQFLEAFYPDPKEEIHLRAFKPRDVEKTADNFAVSLTTTREQLASDHNKQVELKTLNQNRGLYFCPNAGGDADEEIKRFNAFFMESDSLPIAEQYARLANSPLLPSVCVQTKKSVHAYWLISGECSEEAWRDVQARLIAYFDGDIKIKNPSRVMRLPFFNHLSASGEKVRVEIGEFNPEQRYTPIQMVAAFPSVEIKDGKGKETYTPSLNNLETWDALNSELRRRMLSHSSCRIRGQWAHLRGVCHNGSGETALALNVASGAYSCQNGCPTSQILVAFGLPERPEKHETKEVGMENPAEPVKGIFEVSDISGLIDELYEQGLTAGVSTGWKTLDEFYTVKRGQWTVITGMPSMGKSAVLDALLVNLALQHGWRFAVCSPENQPLQRHAAALMEIWAGQAFSRGTINRMDRETKDSAKNWLAQHFTFILPDEADCTLPGILDLVGQAKDRHKLDGVVIDPWNELEHRRPVGMSETEYTSQALSKMRRFARFEDVHLWLVAHPTKLQKDPKTQNYPVPTLYDISGSAHFRNKADMGLSVWRDVSDERSATEIHVQKVRFRECGRIGNSGLYFDRNTGRFSEQPTSPFDSYVKAEPEEFKY